MRGVTISIFGSRAGHAVVMCIHTYIHTYLHTYYVQLQRREIEVDGGQQDCRKSKACVLFTVRSATGSELVNPF